MEIMEYIAGLDLPKENRDYLISYAKEHKIKDNRELDNIKITLDNLANKALELKLSIKDVVLEHKKLRKEYEEIYDAYKLISGNNERFPIIREEFIIDMYEPDSKS